MPGRGVKGGVRNACWTPVRRNGYHPRPLMRLRPLLTLAVALACAAGAAAQDAPVVRSVDIEGLRIHPAEDVRLKMETQVGKPYSRATLERDIRRLYQTGWFAEVRKSERCVETGPEAVIVLEVLENDVLKEIVYVGNRQFNDKEISEGALLKTGEYFAPYKVKLDADRIRDRYVEEGFAFAKVEAAQTATGSGTVVTLTVREGPRVRVSDIWFTGNVELSSWALGREMATKERTFWSILTPPVYKASQLAGDMDALVRYARGEGFLDARVFVRELTWDSDKSNVDVHIQVEEGMRYVVDSVTFEGNALFPTEELLRDLRVLPGAPFALKLLDRDERWMVDRYGEQAYIDARVTPVPEFTGEPGHVRLRWRIVEGEKVYVGRIDFLGNNRTREKVLRREMRLEPGEAFNKRHLDLGMDRIGGLRFFEPAPLELLQRAWPPARDPVVVVEVIPGEEPDERDVVVHVREGRTGNFKIGGSYSDDGGFSGLLEVTQNNFDLFDIPKSVTELITGEGFAGAGQIFQITLQPGFERSRYQASFTEPWIFDWPISMTHSLTHYDQDFRFYRERRSGTTLDFGRRWDDFAANIPGRLDPSLSRGVGGGILQGISYAMIHLPGWFFFDDHLVQGYGGLRFWERNWSVGLGYRLYRINILDPRRDAPLDVFEVAGSNYLSSVTARVAIDRRNSRVFPSQGFVSNFSWEQAGYPFGGDFNYWKAQFRHAAYSTLWTRKDGGKWIVQSDIRAGYAKAVYLSSEVPIFERFYAGGYSLRGFEPRTISPKERDEPIGGHIMALASLELSFPIIRPEVFGRDIDVLRGAFFTDWGTVVANSHDFGRFRWSVGFGIRLQIPLGPQVVPITVDFGFPLREQEDDEGQTVHIGFDFGF